ncbi:MAG: hypothetical protein ACR2PW_01370 [Gammaproteobacteria bacterium]
MKLSAKISHTLTVIALIRNIVIIVALLALSYWFYYEIFTPPVRITYGAKHNAEYSALHIGSKVFYIDKRYLLDLPSLLLGARSSNTIKTTAISIEMILPNLNWTDEIEDRSAKAMRIFLISSEDELHIYTHRNQRYKGLIGLSNSETITEIKSDIHGEDIQKMIHRVKIPLPSKPYAANQDYYFYKNDRAHMSCEVEGNPKAPKVPHCDMYFMYEDVQVKVHFNQIYKADFVAIMQAITDLLASFETKPVTDHLNHSSNW